MKRKVFKRTAALFFALIIIVAMFTVLSASAENANIEEGEYLIENMKNDIETRDHQVFDIKDSSTDDSAVVILNNKNGSDSEKFTLIKIEDNKYNIQNVKSGKFLYVDDTVGEFPTLVQGETKGEFSFETVKDEWVAIKDNASGQYLKVDDTMHKTVRPILTSEMGDSLYLKWRFLDSSSAGTAASEKTGEAVTQTTSTPSSSSPANYTWIIICAAVVCIAVIIVVIVLVTKSKKKK